MAKNEETFYAASLDEFGSSRPDDFDFLVVDSTYNIHKSSRSANHYLFVDVTMDLEDGSDPDGSDLYVERIFAGYLTDPQGNRMGFAPSKDRQTLAGPEGVDVDHIIELGKGDAEIDEGDEELYSGYYAVTNVKGQLLPVSPWSQFKDSAVLACREKGKELDTSSLRSDILKGYRFHGVRMDADSVAQLLGSKPSKRRSPKEGEEQREFNVLVITDMISEPDAKKKSASKTTKPPVKEQTAQVSEEEEQADETDTSEEGVESRLEDVVVGLLGSANGKPVARRSLTPQILSSFESQEDKAEVASYLNDKWFGQKDRPWKFDAAAKTLTL